MRLVLLGIVTSVLYVSTGVSADTQTDFDADGLSDLSFVKIESDKTLTWKARSSTSGGELALGTLGKEGDHLAPGKWLGNGKVQIGTTSIQGSDILWTVKDDAGTVSTRIFGKKGDVALGGAYINDNDIADAMVARLRGKVAVWEIAYDLFTKETVDPTRVEFGAAGDRVFFASLNGTRDLLGIVSKDRNSRSSISLYDPATGEERIFRNFPAFVSAGGRPRPFGLSLPNDAAGLPVANAFVFQRLKGSKTIVSIFNTKAAKLAEFEVEGDGIVVGGDFTADPGEELAVESKTELKIFNTTLSKSVPAPLTSGILVDEANFNVMNGVYSTRPTNGNGGGNSGGNSVGGSGGETPSTLNACKSMQGWPGSHIYKTLGSHHFTDIRRNTIGVIVKPGGKGPFPGCIDAVDSSGKVVARLGLYAMGGGWQARYYAGINCGGSTPFNGASVGGKARANTGSSTIYMNFGSVCYGPIDATRCVGSSSC